MTDHGTLGTVRLGTTQLAHAALEGCGSLNRLKLAYGLHSMGAMREGRLTIHVAVTKRKLRLCQRSGHPKVRAVTLTHIEAEQGSPWVKVTRHACARCGWHDEPNRQPLEAAATNHTLYSDGRHV